MKLSNNKDFSLLFSNLCCSRCRNDFTWDSINILEQNGNLLICNLACSACGKDFGKIVLNFDKKSKHHNPLVVIDGPPPISTDDVINAHKFIKNNLK